MNVLILGSGGREHALAWALRRSPELEELHCIPGNPGIATIASVHHLSLSDHDALLAFAEKHRIDLTIVGPEGPLADGIVDAFTMRRKRIFGPTRRAAELEWSKAFAKEFMHRHSIPTAAYRSFALDDHAALHEYLTVCSLPVVVKADGLAAGKGVLICHSREEAQGAYQTMIEARAFGSAGDRIVVEEFLEGEEASVFALTDGRRHIVLAAAQDHKRANDGDQGKNTGGMGAYAPAPCVTPEILQRTKTEIIEPVIAAMKDEGREYRGCLYVGLMLKASGPKVVEFNCRFGDPETQVVLPLYQGDLLRTLASVADGALSDNPDEHVSSGKAVCVVLASGGYPDTYQTGLPISGLESLDATKGVVAFHAGTSEREGALVTAGGRVVGVTAFSMSTPLEHVIKEVYEAASQISFDGMHYRTDIARRALTH